MPCTAPLDRGIDALTAASWKIGLDQSVEAGSANGAFTLRGVPSPAARREPRGLKARRAISTAIGQIGVKQTGSTSHRNVELAAASSITVRLGIGVTSLH